MIAPSTKRRETESGQTILLVAVSLAVILGMAALAIDVVTLYNARNEAQRAADAAALAGAKALVDSGVTSDPCNTTLATTTAETAATNAASAVVQQNLIAGQPGVIVGGVPSFPNIGSAGCTGTPPVPGLFNINPQISVTVQRTGLPTYFARIFSRQSASVSATAIAEGYNPSNSEGVAANAVPLSPRCGKPLIFPNCDPDSTAHPKLSHASDECPLFSQFVEPTTGAIINPGQYPAGIVGEVFRFTADCSGATCGLPFQSPSATASVGFPAHPLLEYYPLAFGSVVHSCRSCGASVTGYEQDLACCSAANLQCGTQVNLDSSQNPDSGSPPPSETGGQCMIHESIGTTYDPTCSTGGGPNPQDCLDTNVYPFRLLAGSANPYQGSGVTVGDQISTSDSLVAIPIYDNHSSLAPTNPVTIVGFLQVFTNDVAPDGEFTGTIVNVAGCDTRIVVGTPVQGGATMLPVRLIHQ